MEKFKIIANIVLDFMIENHYSEHSLSQYKRIYETMGEYLTENNPELFTTLPRMWLKAT